jgi:hypothetical protein
LLRTSAGRVHAPCPKGRISADKGRKRVNNIDCSPWLLNPWSLKNKLAPKPPLYHPIPQRAAGASPRRASSVNLQGNLQSTMRKAVREGAPALCRVSCLQLEQPEPARTPTSCVQVGLSSEHWLHIGLQQLCRRGPVCQGTPASQHSAPTGGQVVHDFEGSNQRANNSMIHYYVQGLFPVLYTTYSTCRPVTACSTSSWNKSWSRHLHDEQSQIEAAAVSQHGCTSLARTQ